MGADPQPPPDATSAPGVSQAPVSVEIPGSDVFVASIGSTNMPIVICDARLPDCPIVFANDAFAELTLYTREDVIGRNCRFLQGPQTDRQTVAEIAHAVAQREKISVELLNYRKDGSTFWNALFISPVFDQRGELSHFFASLLDVTRRRHVEDVLRQAQKMEALGQLTGGIAHDFNNLLQVILGYVDIVAAGLKKPDADRGRLTRATDNIRTAAERAATLTQQLLSFARKQRLDGRMVDLNAVIAGMDDMARRTLGESITLETRTAPDLWTCKVDPTQAEVAILNILINARDAMPKGGTVTIATENRQLELGAGTESSIGGGFVTVSITDTGQGIPREMLAHVMDPFFTTKEEGKGTGLGLSMVYGFAKQSGGSVQIESTVGEGTTVRLSFPAMRQEQAQKRKARVAESVAGGTETVLIVDDREDVADLARTILRDHGYVTLIAANGREALQVLDARDDVALLFSDLIMPGGMNGLMLAREATRRRPKLKVLLTTGYAEASLERSDIGGSEFEILNKPYRRADLIQRVRKALDER